MVFVASVLLVLAAVLHVYIFWLESFAWTAPRTRATFGVSAEQAEQTKPLAFNQGFYNLFLAIVVLVAMALRAGAHDASVALAVAGAGSMVGAALVLVASDRSKARAAATQGMLPALGLIALAFAG
ncbi:MAG TPA: DUF1304 domain-containing protein [Flexivirga sp.]|uniref:DUF1304 domain-containing protein n=1 Tax=Flexivirga sp. TaxID=1962927 RepID=UPI002BE0A389|nr:DUF1304 domain-containing protein [Flexivirga sp.]HWC22882.1 DUF1304 domain-containing protein [Flexivirga sp.]